MLGLSRMDGMHREDEMHVVWMHIHRWMESWRYNQKANNQKSGPEARFTSMSKYFFHWRRSAIY